MSEFVARHVPTKLGRYEIVGRLAAGGMAEILLGRLTGPIGFERAVVIKRVLPHLVEHGSFIDMFVDEARICAGIHHNNVVQVYELSQEAGEFFIVMEHLQGENVASLIRRLHTRGERIPYSLAAYIIAEACAGLHAAHELVDRDGQPLGVVHRDVSPHNVFVTFDGQVKVLDFGIAKAAGRITQTETGSVKGKYAYMSPEQCLGEPLDRRSDVFSLGILLYELSCGRRLFKRDSDLMVLKAVTELPVPSPREQLDDYPEFLELICLRALQRPLANRYQNAADMRSELFAAMHSLGLKKDPQRELAKLMTKVFPDRIAEKLQMVSRLEAGSSELQVPTPEVDHSVDLPTVVADRRAEEDLRKQVLLSQTVAPVEAGLAPRRKWWLWFVVLGAVCGAAFYATVVTGERSVTMSPSPVPTLRPSPKNTAATTQPPRATSDEPAVPPAPMTVTVDIDSAPAGAVVFVGERRRGVTPLQLTVPRGEERFSITLEKEGFSPVVEMVEATTDQRIKLVLAEEPVHLKSSSPQPKEVRPAKNHPRPKKTTDSESKTGDKPAEDSAFHRFD